MKTLRLSGLVAVVALSGSAMAATITQTQNFSGTTTYSSSLTFNQFDDAGGWRILSSIELRANTTAVGGALRLDNDQTSAASGSVNFGSQTLLSSNDVVMRNTSGEIFQSTSLRATGSASINLGADDGDTEVGGTSNYSQVGVDFGSYTGGTTNSSASGFVKSSYFVDYIGSGTFAVSVDASQVADYSSFSGVQAQIDPLTSSGSMTIIYTYTAVPEPAAMALLGLTSIPVLRRRRSK